MWDPWQHVSHLSKQEIGSLQNKKLASFMRHQAPYIPYYRKLFRNQGLRFADIRTTEDLVKIPFTFKEDIAPTDTEPGRPRDFILQPDEKLIRKIAPKRELIKILAKKLAQRDVRKDLEWEYKPIHTHFTTGRSAAPTAFTYSARDLEFLKESGSRMFGVTGLTRDQIAINGFPYAPHLAFWLAYHALEKVGMTSLQTGGGKSMGTQKIINAIERTKANALIFMPGYAYYLLREAVQQGKDFSRVSHIIFGGERLSPGLREKVRELMRQLGAPEVKILATYAFTEGKTAWIQCAENSGYHLYPDIEFIELVDKNGNRVGEDEEGEIVYTGLDWRGSTVIRYRTGDITKGITYRPCPYCGRTVPRIHPDIQRKSEVKEFHLTKVKGQLVNLNNFYPVLSGMKDIEEWQVEIRKKDNDAFGLDEVVIYVAPKSGVDENLLTQQIQQAVYQEAEVTPLVFMRSLPELLTQLGMETELKELRIVDKRPK